MSDDKQFTVHAAYGIGEGRHITVFYSDRCDPVTLMILIEHMKSLPTHRKIKTGNIVTLGSEKDLVGVELEIMKENGVDVDYELMEKLTQFSDKYSFRSYLGKNQYTFRMHTTLGTIAENPDTSVVKSWNLETGDKYIKTHGDGNKFYF